MSSTPMNSDSAYFVAADGTVTLDSRRSPISEHQRVYDSEIQEAAGEMIRSVSGWRAVFSDAADSMNPVVLPPMRYLAAAMALSFVRFLRSRHWDGAIIVACDGRPTGPMIADIMIRTFEYLGMHVLFAGVCPSPEAVALAEARNNLAGMCYISASHNPPGFNGVKWFNGKGQILPAEDAHELSLMLDRVVKPWEFGENLRRLVVLADADAVKSIVEGQKEVRGFSLREYHRAVTERASRGVAWGDLCPLFSPSTVIADMNGGARATSIDKSLLAEAHAKLIEIAASPGDIRHAIEPEGTALDECARALQSIATGESIDGSETDESKRLPGGSDSGGDLVVAYLPDNDGDRGNLVLPAESPGSTPLRMGGQEVFCLSVVAELAWLRARGVIEPGATALVVNGATSLRINAIAEALDVKVFRAEVGEAHVLAAAKRARAEGYFVPIIGEGSNGGNITFPGTIRDPLSTVISILRLTQIRSANTSLLPGGTPLACALELLGKLTPGDDERTAVSTCASDQTIHSLLRSLPPWATIPVTDPQAKIRIDGLEHAVLKARIESVLENAVDEAFSILSRHSVTSCEIHNFEGSEERIGAGNRSSDGDQSGGFAIWFLNSASRPVAFTWMRGSRTEPVFRLIADVQGETIRGDDTEHSGAKDSAAKAKAEAEVKALLQWKRTLIQGALS